MVFLNNATNLGTFTATDSIKQALQDLETSSLFLVVEQVQLLLRWQEPMLMLHRYLTFVDANNASKTQEDIQTDAGVTYNPSTNILTVGECYHSGIGGTNVTLRRLN